MKGESAFEVQQSNLIVDYFNSQTIDYELFSILGCILCQFHHFLAMKLIDLHAWQIECMRRVGCVPAHLWAIMHV